MMRFLLSLALWAMAACSCCSYTDAALMPHNGFMLMPTMSVLHARQSVSADPDDDLSFEAQAQPHRFEIEGQKPGAGFFFGPPAPPLPPFGPKGKGKHGYTPYVMFVQPVQVEQPVITPVITPLIKETIVQPRVEVRTVVTPVLYDQHSENAPITEKERVVSHTDAVVQPTQQKKSRSGGIGARSYASPTITTLQPASMQVYSAADSSLDDSPSFTRDRPWHLSAETMARMDRPRGRHAYADIRSNQ